MNEQRAAVTYDVCIIGGGAAGLFCAITAAQRGRRVVLLDHATTPGRKILISGGGRCNFTNRRVGPENYLSQNPGKFKTIMKDLENFLYKKHSKI